MQSACHRRRLGEAGELRGGVVDCVVEVLPDSYRRRLVHQAQTVNNKPATTNNRAEYANSRIDHSTVPINARDGYHTTNTSNKKPQLTPGRGTSSVCSLVERRRANRSADGVSVASVTVCLLCPSVLSRVDGVHTVARVYAGCLVRLGVSPGARPARSRLAQSSHQCAQIAHIERHQTAHRRTATSHGLRRASLGHRPTLLLS